MCNSNNDESELARRRAELPRKMQAARAEGAVFSDFIERPPKDDTRSAALREFVERYQIVPLETEDGGTIWRLVPKHSEG